MKHLLVAVLLLLADLFGNKGCRTTPGGHARGLAAPGILPHATPVLPCTMAAPGILPHATPVLPCTMAAPGILLHAAPVLPYAVPDGGCRE